MSTTDVEKLRSDLLGEVQKAARKSLEHGRVNYWVLKGLLALSVASSIAAGILAMADIGTPALQGLVALLPAAAVAISTNFKLQEKASWHYEKHNALEAISRSLRFEWPEAAQRSDVAAVSKEVSKLEQTMDLRWAESLPIKVSAGVGGD